MKKIFGAIAVVALAVIGALVIPSIAQAHTGDMNISAVCNTSTGEYDLTVSLTTANTGLSGETRWRVGTGSFDGTPASAAGMDRGPVASSGAQTVILGSFSLPGDTTGLGPWVYAHTTWTDDYALGSDGQLRSPLAGDCKIPEQPADLVGDETRDLEPVCAVPADGTADIISEKRTWSQTHIWNAEAWEWQLSAERVYSEWQQSGSMIVDLDECAAVVPPAIDPPNDTPTPLPTKPISVQTAALASTGSATEPLWWIAISLIALGLGVAGSRLVRGSAVKSEGE